MADVVRHGRLRWFGHLKQKSADDWVSSCRDMEVVAGVKCIGRKTWRECMKDDLKLFGLQSEWAVFRDMWRVLIWGKRLTLAQRRRKEHFQNK